MPPAPFIPATPTPTLRPTLTPAATPTPPTKSTILIVAIPAEDYVLDEQGSIREIAVEDEPINAQRFLVESVEGFVIILAKKAGAPSKYDRIRFYVLPEIATRIVALRAGDVDAIYDTPPPATESPSPAPLPLPTKGLLGPTEYLSQADSPFTSSGVQGSFFLEDFEDGSLDTPGVTASAGTVVPPGFESLIDSVDGDDGSIDGSGLGGHSFFSSPGAAGITFSFDADVLGALPSYVGIVWTDGAGTTTFEAFDAAGNSLGAIGPVSIADGSHSGTTGDDRLFSVVHEGGVSAIWISNTAGGIEVDHLQYAGQFSLTIPTP